MPLILYECALHRFRQRLPDWTLLIKVIFKFISALKPWLACTIFSAILLLHVRIHSSKNYSPIFLPVFTLISSITLPINTPRMKNQSILSTLPFLHSTPTIQPIFLKHFYIFFIFMQLPNFYHEDGTGHTKGPPAENDRRPEKGPEALDYTEAARVGEHLQLLPPFLDSPGREQSDPLPTVETCQLIISG